MLYQVYDFLRSTLHWQTASFEDSSLLHSHQYNFPLSSLKHYEYGEAIQRRGVSHVLPSSRFGSADSNPSQSRRILSNISNQAASPNRTSPIIEDEGTSRGTIAPRHWTLRDLSSTPTSFFKSNTFNALNKPSLAYGDLSKIRPGSPPLHKSPPEAARSCLSHGYHVDNTQNLYSQSYNHGEEPSTDAQTPYLVSPPMMAPFGGPSLADKNVPGSREFSTRVSELLRITHQR